MEIPQSLRDTVVTTVVNKVNTTVTTVESKGKNYAQIDNLYSDLSDLVNPQFKGWYCKQFYRLGADTIHKFAAISRQEAKTDKRKYFSYLLKHGIV